jgi:hypothetical protein
MVNIIRRQLRHFHLIRVSMLRDWASILYLKHPTQLSGVLEDTQSSSQILEDVGTQKEVCSKHFCVNVDATFQTPVEGADEYDLIEWAAKLDWCNGKIGLGGVSYLVQSQWMVHSSTCPI